MFEWLFGKSKKPNGGEATDELPDEAQAVTGLQREYWTYRPEEHTALQARGWDQLTWPERLRLHHLHCLALLQQEPFQSEMQRRHAGTEAETPATPEMERCQETADRLLAADSPYRPRPGMAWLGEPGPKTERPPDVEGPITNASLTHLGSLEVLRLDPQMHPVELAFVPFEKLSIVAFAAPSLFRMAKLFYDTGEPPDVVYVPLLYGLTWHGGDEAHRSGRMTTFVAHLRGAGPASGYAVGLGQQDLAVEGEASQKLIGLGGVAQFAFALEITDPQFDQKCRARGLDPDEARKGLAEPGH